MLLLKLFLEISVSLLELWLVRSPLEKVHHSASFVEGDVREPLVREVRLLTQLSLKGRNDLLQRVLQQQIRILLLKARIYVGPEELEEAALNELQELRVKRLYKVVQERLPKELSDYLCLNISGFVRHVEDLSSTWDHQVRNLVQKGWLLLALVRDFVQLYILSQQLLAKMFELLLKYLHFLWVDLFWHYL